MWFGTDFNSKGKRYQTSNFESNLLLTMFHGQNMYFVEQEKAYCFCWIIEIESNKTEQTLLTCSTWNWITNCSCSHDIKGYVYALLYLMIYGSRNEIWYLFLKNCHSGCLYLVHILLLPRRVSSSICWPPLQQLNVLPKKIALWKVRL